MEDLFVSDGPPPRGPFESEWTVPLPRPAHVMRPIRPASVAIGAGIALAGQAVAIGLGLFGMTSERFNPPGTYIIIELPLQVGLMYGSLIVGANWVSRPHLDRGIGVGLLGGWLLGVAGFLAVSATVLGR
ncbi:hypothetical protein ABZS66_09510 [Dactylosporangium sp. NPDC005572]|uniref:hypothetical protein n=1 Tax=Dactylosporangium sp. NPDC005572 TaxID=3156889 RepID=UPI0033BD4A09